MLALEAYGLHIPGAAIDRAAVDAGIDIGPLPIDGIGPGTEPVVVFLGDDVVDLARWAGVPVVALDGRPLAWLADETRADEWLPILTPAGRTAWMQTGAAAWPDGGCDPPPDATPPIDGVRSITCWTDRDRCLEAVEIARGIAPDAFTPSTEVAAGLGPGCPPTARCAWTGPNDPVYVTAAPAGWAAADMVRAFGTGLRPLSGISREVAAPDVAPWMLALASRPGGTLPVPDPVDEPAPGTPCVGEERRGILRGSPWDLRVAWVGDRRRHLAGRRRGGVRARAAAPRTGWGGRRRRRRRGAAHRCGGWRRGRPLRGVRRAADDARTTVSRRPTRRATLRR